MKITVKHTVPTINISVITPLGKRVVYNPTPKKELKAYINRTPVNVTVTKVDDQNLGWGTFTNTLHTEENPFTFNADEPFVFPLRNDEGITAQAPQVIKDLINNENNKITAQNIDDIFLMRLEFTMSTELSKQPAELHFDIGGEIAPFNFEKWETDIDTVNPKPTTLLLMFFQRSTFIANGAQVICTVADDGELWNIVGTPIKLDHGK